MSHAWMQNFVILYLFWLPTFFSGFHRYWLFYRWQYSNTLQCSHGMNPIHKTLKEGSSHFGRNIFLLACISIIALGSGDFCRYTYAEFKMTSELWSLAYCGHEILFLGGSRIGHVTVTCYHEIIVLFSFVFRDNYPYHSAYKRTQVCN